MKAFRESDLTRDVPLADKTTIGLGGPARFSYAAPSAAALWEAVCWARQSQLPWFILGGGSNVVFPDAGFPGLVISVNIRGFRQETVDDKVRWTVGGGETWDDLVHNAVAQNHAGIECLSGIPGMVGAAPIQNIGAYGAEVGQVLESVRVLDLLTGKELVLARSACGLAYRTSIFKHGPQAGRHVVLSLTLLLEPGGSPNVSYPDLLRQLEPGASLLQVRAAVLKVRAEKSMLANRQDPNAWSCGSFFTNPIIEQQHYARFEALAACSHPHWSVGSGLVKLSAAWLIENAGFSKGYVWGTVGLSEKHCLALINRGNGSSADVMGLMEEIKAGVATRFGIQLEPEPVILTRAFRPWAEIR